jgi:hypothetical protein
MRPKISQFNLNTSDEKPKKKKSTKRSRQDQDDADDNDDDDNERRQQRSSSEKRSRFRSSLPPIQITCAPPSTKEFNSCIDSLVSNEDEVLIVRGTTAASNSSIWKSSVSSSAFDGGENQVATVCGGRSPKVYQGSTWDITALNDLYDGRENHDHRPSIVCIDFANIHGNDILIDSIVLIRLLRSVFDSTLSKIIIKSRILSNHSRSYQSCQSFLQKAKKQLEEQGSVTRDVKKPEVQVICAVGVSDYRSTIPYVVHKGDLVLEVGCHFGKTTDLLAKAAYGGVGDNDSSSVMGIDIGKVCIDRARKLYSTNNKNL